MIRNRSELTEIDISDERLADLEQAYDETTYHDTIQLTQATVFQPSEPIEKSGMIIGSRLDRDRVFPYTSGCMNGNPSEGERIATKTVKDPENGSQIRVDVWKNQILICPRSESVPFQTFRDYILFLERSLGTDSNTILPLGVIPYERTSYHQQ